jgi:hypothetical protein
MGAISHVDAVEYGLFVEDFHARVGLDRWVEPRGIIGHGEGILVKIEDRL